jgi:SAM-dependent methyltransferase
MSATIGTVLDGYARDAAALIPRYAAISPEAVLAPVADLLPEAPARVLDAGAGVGRDAGWLAGRGHEVLAVEPVEALRRAGIALHPSERITWMEDRLPELPAVRGRAEAFDLILLSGVWQHLDAEARGRAVPVLAALTARGGLLLMSLRHGPGAPGRPCFECSPEETIEQAASAGLTLAARRAAASIQAANRAAGVHWTWLAFAQR